MMEQTNMNKKLLFLFFLLMTTITLCAQQESVEYVECSWNADSSKVVKQVKNCDQYIEITGNTDNDIYMTDGNWYVVRGGNVTCSKNVIVSGTVHIILYRKSSFYCYNGIKVEVRDNAELHIHTQPSGMGTLHAEHSNYKHAGIGSWGDDSDNNAGTIVIHGGNIYATGGESGAGIGGGKSCSCGIVRIYDGEVTAQGGKDGAGIGGGEDRGINVGTGVYIYGGTVNATGGYDSAAIGAANGGWQGAPVYIYGGTVNAIAGNNASGIGGPISGSGGDVYIYGGKVTAQGGDDAAAIGGGSGRFDHIYISGGEVIATGGKNAAAIGNGNNPSRDDVKHQEINISGGIIRATGGEDGAGIGSGYLSSVKKIIISGGDIRSVGKRYAAGIGGGNMGTVESISITGGTIVSIAGEECVCREAEGGSSIGNGDFNWHTGDGDKDTFRPVLSDYLMVSGGDSEDNIDGTYKNSDRAYACVWRNYIRIEPCDHREANFDVTETGHEINCNHCYAANLGFRPHNNIDQECTICHYTNLFATWNDDSQTLRFAYGTPPAEGSEYVGVMVEKVWKGWDITRSPSDETPGWQSFLHNCRHIVFEPLFSNARPNSLHAWFKGCDHLTDIQGMDNLNTENVTDMSEMFEDCNEIETLNLSSFNTSKVVNTNRMFYNCNKLQTILVGDSWNMDNVEQSDNMFAQCSSLVGGAGTFFDETYTDKTYANVDMGSDSPGYLTNSDLTSIHFNTLTDEGNKNTEIYDLAGRKHSFHNLSKGIYIQNGKKFVLK